MRTLLLVLAFAAAPAWSQQAPPKPEEKPSSPRERPLNLKLDQPARMFVQEVPGEKNADNLPTLGGGATSFERRPEQSRAERGSPYPKDWESQGR